MNAPKLTDLPLWNNFASRAVRVLREGLALLPTVQPDMDELLLNRLLYESIAEANRLINLADGGGFEYLPAYDGYQAPESTAAPPDEFESKRPDFAWSLQDHTAPTGLVGCREFVVECKRLGNGPDLPNLNHLYVDRGILRFVATTHKYGLHGASGAMVGYVQRSDNATIFAAVVERVAHHHLAEIRVPDGLAGAIAQLDQQLDRAFGESPFHLFHFWVDVRPAAAA